MKLKVFLSASSILILGLALYSLFNFFIIFLLGKEYGVFEVGKYSLALSIITPLYIFIYQSYRTYIVTYRNIECDIYDLYAIRFLFSLLFIVPVCFLSWYINNYFIIIVFFVKFVEGLSDISYSFYNRDKKIYFIGFSNALKSFFAMILMYLLFKNYNIYLSFTFLIIFYFLFFIFYDAESRLKLFSLIFRKILNIKNILCIFIELHKKMSFMIYSALIAGLVYHVPKYYLGLSSSEQLGIFTIVTSLSIAINLIAISMGQVIQPYVKDMKSGKLLMAILFMLFILLLIISSIFLFVSYFYEYIFIEYLKINFTLYDFLLCNCLFLSIYIGQILSFIASSYKKYRGVFFINLFSVVFLLIFSKFFIDEFGGVFGVSLLFMIIGIIQIIGYSIIIYKNSGENLELS